VEGEVDLDPVAERLRLLKIEREGKKAADAEKRRVVEERKQAAKDKLDAKKGGGKGGKGRGKGKDKDKPSKDKKKK